LQRSLQQDRQARIQKVADEAQLHFAAQDTRQAYRFLQNWYMQRKIKPTNPTINKLDNQRNKYQQLYLSMPMTELPIQTYVNYQINEAPPNKEEIVHALMKLRNWKAPGAWGISVQDLKKWYQKAQLLEDISTQDIQLWEIVALTTLAFETRQVQQTFYNGVLVLIPKLGKAVFRGITLLETVYKLVLMIRLTSMIILHDSKHGF
jgi:hypothetical protein